MIRASVFAHSKGGMVGAVTLGLGRAMGETIAVALVIGSNPQITAKLFAPGYSMPSVIANEFGESSGDCGVPRSSASVSCCSSSRSS